MSSDWPFDPETGEILDEPAVQANVAEFTVSELSFALKKTLEDRFGYVRVRAELGRVSRPASGHVYLDLKDEKSVLAAVIWKGTAARLKIRPEQGLEVVVSGRITTYPGQSKYQLIVETMEPAGVGALMALLEERKKKLAAEGLFDESRKQELPYLPRVVGVVTSPTGAVIRDILHRLRERFPRRVLVWPVRVQGETSAAEVAAGIRGFNALGDDADSLRPDLIIVARGGGSLEDLWGFNEEEVVRAAAESAIPLISAVGHETDWTLIDHVADWRAPTPTAAAERAVPVKVELEALVADLAARKRRALMRSMTDRRARIVSASRALPRPDDVLALARQRFDSATGRLIRGLQTGARSKRAGYTAVAGRVSVRTIYQQISLQRDALARLGAQARRGIDQSLRARRDGLVSVTKLLASLSYQSVLQRGFALVRDDKDSPVHLASALAPGSRFSVEFQDGRIGATADGGEKPSRKSSKPQRSASSAQGDLF